MTDWIPIEYFKDAKEGDYLLLAMVDGFTPRALAINIGRTDGGELSYLVNDLYIVDLSNLEDFIEDKGFTYFAELTPPGESK